jgi:hypothetical protein
MVCLLAWILASMTSAGAVSAGPLPRDPGPDLPPIGRSDFDHWVFEQGGLPTEFEELVRRLGGTGVVIPFGRSTQRFSTDLKSPREAIGNRRQIFIGRSAEKESLEVISRNLETGRTEFQIVRDYAPGKIPRIEYANRAFCMSCHQAGAAIFSEGPWDEMGTQDELGMRLRAIHGERLHGIPVGVRDVAQDYDFLVGDNARWQHFQDLWKSACGPSPAVKRKCRMLALRAAWKNLTSESPEVELRALERLVTRDYGPTPFRLRRRDPILNEVAREENLPQRRAAYARADDSQLLRAARAPVPAELDPLTPRALTGPIRQTGEIPYRTSRALMVGVQFELDSFLQAGPIPYPEQRAFVPKLTHPRIRAALESDVFKTHDVWDAILQTAGHAPTRFMATLKERVLPPPVTSVPTTLRLDSPMPGLEHFKRNCLQCHIGQAEPRLNFMETSSDEELWKRLVKHPEVFRRLDWDNIPLNQRMPPPASLEGHRLANTEAQLRTGMLEELRLARLPQGGHGIAGPGCHESGVRGRLKPLIGP